MSELNINELPLQKQVRYYTFATEMETCMKALMTKDQYEGLLEITKDLFLQFLFKDVLIEQLLIGSWSPDSSTYTESEFMSNYTKE